MSLEGKIAIVTGASRGIGKAAAEKLLEQGARVAVTCVGERSEQAMVEWAKQYNDTTTRPSVFTIRFDISKVAECKPAVERILKGLDTDHIDILFNNAGVFDGYGELSKLTEEAYDNVFNVNVKGLIFFTQAVEPYIANKGRIINNSSIASRSAFGKNQVYAPSKSAVDGLTRCWADEFGHRGITVNALLTGPTKTDMFYGLPQVYQESPPGVLGEFTSDKDVANVVVMLAEERAQFITGDCVSVNGGILFT